MELFDFLAIRGNCSGEDITLHVPGATWAKLRELESQGRVSLHYGEYGRLWVSCPPYVVQDPLLKLVISHPGISPTEAMRKLGMTKRTIYAKIKELGILKEKEGNNSLLYPPANPESSLRRVQIELDHQLVGHWGPYADALKEQEFNEAFECAVDGRPSRMMAMAATSLGYVVWKDEEGNLYAGTEKQFNEAR